MANIIVATFTEEKKAIAGMHKMNKLDLNNDITLFEYMMLLKVENDHFEVLNVSKGEVTRRTLSSMDLEGQLGTIAGPLGLVVGIYIGTAIGSAADIRHFNFEEDFIKKVKNKMKVGTIALVSEVGEDSIGFIDDALNPFAYQIIRTEANMEIDRYIDEVIEDLEDEIEDEREDFEVATADEKVAIKKKIADLKVKRTAKVFKTQVKRKSALLDNREKTKERLDRLESRLERYRDSISEPLQKRKAERIKKRIDRQQERLDKLNESFGEILD